ncbi:MAG: protein kinase [Myxococcaceae bacterium]
MAKPCSQCGSSHNPDPLCPGASLKLIGQVLDGRYQIEEVLGQGGMGMVFRATQTSVQRPVAVKTLHPTLAAAPQFFERFRREAEVASRLRHPNIITIFDFGQTGDGTCYFVMELVEGESLKQLVKREGPLSLGRAVDIIEQAARALAHAHELGVVHRDIKPHNVMVQRLGQQDFVKVLDFGLVKAVEQDDEQQLTSTGQVLGTPQYMPPEQAGGEPVDYRSDLYSLGGVLYFCLTGGSPFGANTVRKALQSALFQTVPSIGNRREGAPVPIAVDEFLRKALAREKEDRYQSAAEFIEHLRAALTGLRPEELAAVPTKVTPASPSREGSGSGTSARRPPAGTVASAPRSSARREQAAASNVIVDPQIRQPSSSSKAAWVAVPILLLGATGAWFLMRPSTEPAGTAAVAPTVTAQAPQETVEAPPSDIEIHFESDPPGAGIYDGAVQIGTTPTDLRVARDKTHRLTFRLAGHDAVERQFDFSRMTGARTQVSISLPKKEPVRKSSAPAPSRPRPQPDEENDIPVFE